MTLTYLDDTRAEETFSTTPAPRLDRLPRIEGPRRLSADPRRSIPGQARGLIAAARPMQWAKNAAVLIVPGLALCTLSVGQMVAAVGAVMVFCLAASSVYLLNDTADRENDRHHPTKRNRPIASGLVSAPLALGAAGAAAAGAVVLGTAIAPMLGVVAAIYLATTAAYSLKLKQVPVVDVVLLAGGFVFRVLAGAVAVGLTAPPLLLIAVFSGAAFVALGKRRSEAVLLGSDAAAHRRTLRTYTVPVLDVSLLDSELVSVMAFGAWIGFAVSGLGGVLLAALAAASLAVALGAYRRVLLGGGGGDPTRDLASSPLVLVSFAVAGLAAMAAGVLG